MSSGFNGANGLSRLSRIPHPDEHLDFVQLYTGRESSGVLALVIIAAFSLTAVTGLLIAIAVSAWNTRKSKSPNLFIRTNVAPYFILLLVSDFTQSVGAFMNGNWVHLKRVETGPFCTAQGVIKHLADVGVAIWALTISIHTFCILFYRMSIPRWVMHATLLVVSIIILFITSIGFAIARITGKGPFYGISGYWCWITEEYDAIGISLDYVIMFASAFFSFILYALVFLRMRGNIVVNGWYIRFRLARNNEWRGREFSANTGLSVAKQMMLYPVAYTFVILPMAVVRSCEWLGQEVPFRTTIICDAIFLSSGLVNVIMFSVTRRLLPSQSVIPWKRILPWFKRPFNPSPGNVDQTHKSFVCRAASDLEKNMDTLTENEDVGLTKDSHRFKIDNHVDNMLTDHTSHVESSTTSLSSIYSTADYKICQGIPPRPGGPRSPPSARVVDSYPVVPHSIRA